MYPEAIEWPSQGLLNPLMGHFGRLPRSLVPSGLDRTSETARDNADIGARIMSDQDETRYHRFITTSSIGVRFSIGETDAVRAAAFLSAFGCEAAGVFIDKAGHPLAISSAWINNLSHYTAEEIARAGRAIAEPDEIWLVWKQGIDGKQLLSRHYISEIGGVHVAADVHCGGWRFATSEEPGFDLDRLRAGTLAWASGLPVKQ